MTSFQMDFKQPSAWIDETVFWTDFETVVICLLACLYTYTLSDTNSLLLHIVKNESGINILIQLVGNYEHWTNQIWHNS